MFKKWGFWNKKKEEKKEKVVEPTHESSFSNEDISGFENLSGESSEPEDADSSEPKKSNKKFEEEVEALADG